MKTEIIKIGTIYNLKDSYKSCYHFAIISYNPKTKETMVDLRSSWDQSYDSINIHKNSDILNVISEYQA